MLQFFSYIIDAVFNFLTVLFLLRFIMQWARVPFQNPAGAFVIALTNWAVKPVRRFVPAFFGLDITSLLLAWISALLLAVILFAMDVGFTPLWWAQALIVSFFTLLTLTVWIIIIAVLIMCIASIFGAYSPVVGACQALSAPFLRPFRRIIPSVSGFDLSPIALMFALSAVRFLIGWGQISLLALIVA